MRASEIRAGFIGCGTHATQVLLPAARAAGIDLAAICDLDKRRAQRITRQFGAFRAYQDHQRMIAEMELDAVLVCGPPELHAEAAAEALACGCHVWVEAPPAPTAAEAQHLAEMAQAKGLVAQVGLMLRFAPAYQRLREIITAADFGELIAFEATFWPPARPGHDDPFIFDALHLIDLIRHLLGEIQEWHAVCVGGRQAAVALRMDSGAAGVASFLQDPPCACELVTVASESSLASVSDRAVVTLRRRDREEFTLWHADLPGPESEGRWGRARGYLPELAHFAASVAGEVEAAAGMADATASMRLVERLAACREVHPAQ